MGKENHNIELKHDHGHDHDDKHDHDHDHRHEHKHGSSSCEYGCGHDHGDGHVHDDGCGCGHDHGAPVERREVIKVAAGFVIFAVAMVLSHTGQTILGQPVTWLFLLSYAIVGYEVLWTAVKNILKGQVFDENFLMSIATVGALLIGEFDEAVAVMLFYQVGELFQDYAVGKSRASIAGLMNIRPDYANLKWNDKITKVSPEAIEIGQQIIIKAGEKVPLDGIVLEGIASLDTSALTGESAPRVVEPGSEILSGCINENGLLTVKVTKKFGESTVSKILELVENSQDKKAKTENFITRFARYYTPAVVVLALAIAIIPPLVISGAVFSDWLYRGLLFLVISCPCALVISIPLGFFGGIGGASKCGVLIKGSNYLEALSKAEIVAFDKTGTLTKGSFKVKKLQPVQGVSEADLLKYCAYAESYSNHPIARSITKEYESSSQAGNDPADKNETDEKSIIDQSLITANEEIAGHGMRIEMQGTEILAGNQKLMKKCGITCENARNQASQESTCVHVAKEGTYLGAIYVGDELKPDAKAAVAELKREGIKKTVMLTGDAMAAARGVAEEVGVDEFYGELLPGDKVHRLEELLSETSEKGMLAYVGDGINDAPVLARADVGIAMGGLGSDAAIEAADIVLMTDEVSKLVQAKRISSKTMKIVKQNIVFAIGVKVAVLALGAFGIATMWEAVFADVGVAVIAIINATRTLRVKN